MVDQRNEIQIIKGRMSRDGSDRGNDGIGSNDTYNMYSPKGVYDKSPGMWKSPTPTLSGIRKEANTFAMQ